MDKTNILYVRNTKIQDQFTFFWQLHGLTHVTRCDRMLQAQLSGDQHKKVCHTVVFSHGLKQAGAVT